MTLKELEKQLQALTTIEKTQAIHILVQSLTEDKKQWIAAKYLVQHGGNKPTITNERAV